MGWSKFESFDAVSRLVKSVHEGVAAGRVAGLEMSARRRVYERS